MRTVGDPCTSASTRPNRRQARTEQSRLEVALVAAEVDEAQHAGGPGRHLRRGQRRHAGVVEHMPCVRTLLVIT